MNTQELIDLSQDDANDFVSELTEHSGTVHYISDSTSGTGTEVGVGNTSNPHPLTRSAPVMLMDTGAESKTWVFTINNYTEAMINNLKAWDVTRLVVSKEVGASGTPHLQGAVTFTRKYRFAALKKLMPTAHIQKAVASDCFNYVAKMDSELVINTDNRSQGKRNDLKDAIETMRTGGLRAVAQGHASSYVKFHRGLKELQLELARPESNWKPGTKREVIYIWGPSGTGKSKYVVDAVGYDDLWESPAEFQGGFFSDYNGHKYVNFDDIRGGTFKFSTLLRLLDIHPLTVPIKGGHQKWVPERIYLTSIKHWSKLYKGTELDGEPLRQLERRITKTIHFTELGKWHECTNPNCQLTVNPEEAQDFADYGL